MFSSTVLGADSPLAEKLEALATELDRPIRLLNGNFGIQPPRDWNADWAGRCGVDLATAQERGITMFSWASRSSTTSTTRSEVPGELYEDGEDRPLPMQEIHYSPNSDHSGVDMHFVGNGPDAFPVAEFEDRTVWFVMNLQYLDSPEKIDFDKFFRVPIEASVDEERMEEVRRAANERMYQQLQEALGQRLEDRVASLRSSIASLELDLRRWEESHRTAAVSLAESGRQLDAMLSGEERDDEELRRKWDAIVRHPSTSRATFEGSRIIIDTNDIDISNDDGETTLLGKIRITFNTSTLAITLENLTNKIRNRDHPHVENGSPCWGSLNSTISQLASDMDIGGLYETILAYLGSYNPEDDWGRYGQWWFNATSREQMENSATQTVAV